MANVVLSQLAFSQKKQLKRQSLIIFPNLLTADQEREFCSPLNSREKAKWSPLPKPSVSQ